MSRNKEKDEAEKTRRKLLAMESAFRLFSEKGIDSVKMSDIVEDCDVSRQSLYRYFSTKTDLVITVGAWKWKEYISSYAVKATAEQADTRTAADIMRYYMESFMDLFRNHRDILRFNYYFNSFMANVQAMPEQKRVYTEVVDRLKASFHQMYEKGKIDKTLKTDLSESVMFSSSFHIMLAAVTRYAMGLVYVTEDGDLEKELDLLKEALLKMYVVEQ